MEEFKLDRIKIVTEVMCKDFNVEVAVADGEKCERCWMYSVTVGEDKENPTICHKCSEALK
mgnify:CR=1 FL=1